MINTRMYYYVFEINITWQTFNTNNQHSVHEKDPSRMKGPENLQLTSDLTHIFLSAT